VSAELDTLHVELARLDGVPLPTDLEWLHASEHQRLAGLKAAARRAQYLAGHWLARRLLATVYGGEARDWQLRERRDRAPAVIAPADSETACSERIELGLAHSGDWLVAAVGRQRFGVDLEQRGRGLPREAFTSLLLNADEVSDGIDDEALLLRWVVKEAWIKREQGSALPARLRALALHAHPAGEVRSYRHHELLLGVASAQQMQFLGATQPSAAGAWRVVDSQE
jgi:4'-phosphopantetheinyl transferase